MSRASLFMRKQLWVWPIVAVLLLSVIGFTVQRAIETTMKENLSSQLQTLLNTEVAMLDTWIRVQMSNVESAANNQDFREAISGLLQEADSNSEVRETDEGAFAEISRQVRRELGPLMMSHDYEGFFICDRSKRIQWASFEDLKGRQDIPEFSSFLARALDGEPSISPPFPSVAPIPDQRGRSRTGVPTMYVAAPIRDAGFQVIGALAFQIRPEEKFTGILQLGRIGESGETFAFNNQGVMVSNSRFDEELILLGVLPDREDSVSILNIQLRDPGGNLTTGYRSRDRRSEQPLTHMAESAIAGNSSVDVDGYRDYRGVPVVGAWTWLPDFNMGVATELDVAEAFRPLTILQRTFWALYALLGISSFAIFVFTLIVSRLQREAQKAAIEAEQLGQYTLEEKIGAGGMGVVYKGRHAMLRRPTAIKLLDIDKVNDASIARFEREVQITCQLNNPHTIAIYDYGRTPEGVFYYAMEYLDGIDLDVLVTRYGPQPEGRVIDLLQQVCASLFEAHSQGLVHRDVKPANIMLNRRGGESDVIKVLDFGLVKALDEEGGVKSTSASGLTGTPLYMSPEAIQTPLGVDHRSDIYAVGAVGYYLLTGRPVFDATSIVELCQQHIDKAPVPPSERLGQSVSPELENALMACLEKSRPNRPQTARELSQLLAKAPTAGSWSFNDADAWWGRHERGHQPSAIGAGRVLGETSRTNSNRTEEARGEYGQTFIGDIDL